MQLHQEENMIIVLQSLLTVISSCVRYKFKSDSSTDDSSPVTSFFLLTFSEGENIPIVDCTDRSNSAYLIMKKDDLDIRRNRERW